MLGTKFTSFMGRPRVWNVSNNLAGMSNLQNTKKSDNEVKNKAFINEKDELLEDKQIYMNVKSEFNSFSQTLNSMANFKGEKKVVSSHEGYFKVKANRDAIEGTFNITVTQLAEHHQIVSNPINIDGKLNINDVLKIDEKELHVTSNMTYKDLIHRINDGDYGVSVYTQGDKVFMHAKKVGELNKINLKDGTSNLFKKLFYTPVKASSIDKLETGTQQYELNTINTPKDAIYSINGIKGSSKSNIVTSIPGIEIELLKETEINNSKGSELKFTVSDSGITDATKLIKKMVANYNTIALSYEKLIKPMQSLQGSAIMGDIYREMNNFVRFSQGDNYLSTFGLEQTDDGTIKVNETKLTKVLEEHPGLAKKFFFGTEGIGKTLGKSFEEIFSDDSIISNRIKNINSRIDELDKKISYIDFYNKEKQMMNVNKYQRLDSASALLNRQMVMMQSILR